jgi:hypothetical protein
MAEAGTGRGRGSTLPLSIIIGDVGGGFRTTATRNRDVTTAAAMRRFTGWGRAHRFDGPSSAAGYFCRPSSTGDPGWNEYHLRLAREADIRQQVAQTTKQFGEEIGELRESARQLLTALAQLHTVKTQQKRYCNALFSKLKKRFANYGVLEAPDTEGRVFCVSDTTVVGQPFFTRALVQPGLAVGNYWVDPATEQRLIHFAQRFEDDQGVVAGWYSTALIWRGYPSISRSAV